MPPRTAAAGDHLPSLLLLPPPPHPATRLALNTAYEPSLRAAISRLKDDKSDIEEDGSVLIVALTVVLLVIRLR